MTRVLVEKLRAGLDRPTAPLWIVLAATLLALPTVWTGLAADDHHFRMVLQGFPGMPELDQSPLDIFTFAHGDPETNVAYIERGILPWWSAPRIRLAFWRPLAAVTHWVDHELWRDDSVPIHLHSLAWFALLAWTAAATYRRFFAPAWVAGLATLLYMIDDARLISVAWIAARNSMMSCTAALVVLLAHDRWRRDGWRPGMALGPLALAFGLLCGESAVGVVGYLIAHALFLDRARWTGRLAGLLPHFLVTAAWLWVYRWSGHGVEGSGLYLDPVEAPGRFVAAVVQHLPTLLLDQFVGVSAGVLGLFSGWSSAAFLAAATLLLGLTGWTLWPLLKRSREARFWAAGLTLAAVPACAVFPQSRVLFLVGIGGAALVARLLAAWLERPVWWFDGRRWATPVGLVAPSWVVIHVILAPAIGVAGCGWMAVYDHALNRLARGIDREATIAEEDVTIVALPVDILQHGIPYLRSSLRWPAPRRLRALYAGLDAVEVRRVDERTLELDAEGSFVSRPWAQMFRGPATDPFSPGDELRLSGLVVSVTEVDERGRAMRARFRFDEPLERASDHWLTAARGGLVPFDLPPVGRSVRLERIDLLQLFKRNLFDYFESGAWLRAHELETGPLEARR